MTLRKAQLELRGENRGALRTRSILISGRSVSDWLEKTTGFSGLNAISPIGWRPCSEPTQPSHARLLPDGPPDFPCGRRAVLVCPECGSFSCGALTVEIRADGDRIVWESWLWQTDYDPENNADFDGRMPGFSFDREQYFEAIA